MTTTTTTTTTSTTTSVKLPLTIEPQHTSTSTSLAIISLKTLLLGSIIICAVVGNALVILSVIRYRNLRTKANVFIVSLAFADLLVALLVMPFSASQEIAERWLFDSLTCDMFNANDVLFSTASLLNLCCISLDRYIAITDPFNYPTRLNKLKVVIILTVAWLASILVSHVPVHLKLYTTDAFAQPHLHQPQLMLNYETLNYSDYHNTVHKKINYNNSNVLMNVNEDAIFDVTNNIYIDSPSNLYSTQNFPSSCCNSTRINDADVNTDVNVYKFLNANNKDNVFVVNINKYLVDTSTIDQYKYYFNDSKPNYNEINSDDDTDAKMCLFQANWVYGILSSIISFWTPTFVMLFTYRKIFNEAKRQVEQIEKLRPTKTPPSPNVVVTEIEGLNKKATTKVVTTAPSRSINDKTANYQSFAISGKDIKNKTIKLFWSGRHSHTSDKNNITTKQVNNIDSNVNYHLPEEKVLKNSNPDFSLEIISQSSTPLQSSSNLFIMNNFNNNAENDNLKTTNTLAANNCTPVRNNIDQDKHEQLKTTPLHKRSFTNLLTAIQTELKNQSILTFQQQAANNENRRRIRKEHKAAKTLGVIMGVFLGCWLPFFIWYLTDSICQEKCYTPKIVVSFLFWVGYTNSALNPLIYAFFNREFRGAFRKQLCQCRRLFSFGRSKRPMITTEIAVSCSDKHNNLSLDASSIHKKDYL